jgi:cytochrome c553
MTSIKTIALALCAAAACATTGAGAADLANGQAKAKAICAACHGLEGNSQVADYPKIGGQYPDYLAKALRDYKSGARKNPIMAGMAASLTPKDIEDVAAYYGSQPATLRTSLK